MSGVALCGVVVKLANINVYVAVDTLHFVIFFFKCEMIPNFGHFLSFTNSFWLSAIVLTQF